MVTEKIKPGYKQTEVGIIPTDWNVERIGDIGRVIRGASPRPKGDKRYYGGNIPRLMVEDVSRDGKFVTPNVDFLTKEGEKRSRPCKKGTLTIVCSGTVGIPSFLAVDACIHDGFLALLEIKNNISDDYLFHQLSNLRNRFESSATHGGIFTNLTTTILEDFLVPFPPKKEEQLSIASVLSDIDKFLEELNRLITKKKNIKQGVMQNFLTSERRLPGFYEKWEIKPLGDVVEFLDERRRPIKDSERAKMRGDIPYYGASGIIDYVNNHLFDEDLILLGEDGDNILTRNSRLAFRVSGKIWVNNHAHILRPKIGIVLNYLTEFLESLDYTQYNTGTAMPRLNKLVCARIPILCPPIAEQLAISKILSDMNDEIEDLEKKRDKYLMIKKGMMQQLLTGKIRLR